MRKLKALFRAPKPLNSAHSQTILHTSTAQMTAPKPLGTGQLESLLIQLYPVVTISKLHYTKGPNSAILAECWQSSVIGEGRREAMGSAPWVQEGTVPSPIYLLIVLFHNILDYL